jgi:lysozyme family protein
MADYKKAIPYYLKKEGCLSRATTDTASRNPAPCTINGKTGWHTNKGVTWSTFKANENLGYTANCENFRNMPPNIWGLIYKKRFWNFWDSDNIPYQSIADFMTWSVWGSGGGTFKGNSGSIPFWRNFLLKEYNYVAKDKNDIRRKMIEIADQKGEKELWSEMIQYRWNWYARLNQPANLKGWRNSLDKYKLWGEQNYDFKKKSGSMKLFSFRNLIALLSIFGVVYYLNDEEII